MADLGNLYFDILLRDMTDADIERIKKKLEKIGVKIGADVNKQTLIANIKTALKNKTFKIDLEANKNIKKAVIEADKSAITNSVRDALRGKTFSADLRLTVRSATVDQAIKDAFAKAGMRYSPFPQGAVTSQRALGDAYRYASKGAYQSAKASVVLGRSFHTNIRLAGELGTVMGNFASVFGIKDILQDIVQVGGQLENQRIALGAILQDGGKATEMFSKIQSLAVKSPFGIMDLNQYTKQLSAYSIPYNELYDTMKRLADISAGVGVDMGRIVLAFGQVRAAGFLKGTELRQFTEANIPMVDKLAERFSNLEKRIVSAGEVYDMISKKKVTFEDVKAVLWDLTGEGGMFNNMQEVLSESLASKWKNLADAIDVMYGKLADGAIGGFLKNLAEGLTELTKNWEYLAAAIGSAAASYALFKGGAFLNGTQFNNTKALYDNTLAIKRQQANSLLLTKTYRELTRAEQQLINTTDRLTIADIKRLARTKQLNKEEALRLIAMRKLDAATREYVIRLYGLSGQSVALARSSTYLDRALATLGVTFKRIGVALKGFFLSPWTWVTVGITAIMELFTYYNKKQDEIEERNRNFAESAKGSAETLERELLKLKDLDISKMNTDEMKIKVKELTTVIQNEADGWQSILSEIFAKEADGTFKNSVEEQLKLLKTKMDELAEAKKKLMGDDEMYSDVIGSTETGMLWWEEDVLDKIKDYNELVKDNDKYLKQLGVHARDVSDALSYAVGDNEAVTEELSGKSLNEQVALLSEYSDEWQKFIRRLSDTNSKAMNIANFWKANVPSKREIEKAFETAKEAMDNAFALKGEDINNFTERGRQTIYGFVDGMITETATQKPKMKQWLYDWWTDIYNIPRNDLDYIVPTDITNVGSGGSTGGSKKDAVAEMWKKRVAEIEKAVKMYDKWKKIEGKLFAENRVKYHDELSNLFNGAYGFNLDLEDPTEAYEYIQSLLDSSKEKQKELKISLGVKLEDAAYNDAQDELKQFLDNTKVFIDKTIKGWDFYKKLFEATGDRGLSMNLAFGGNVAFKNSLEELKSKIVEVMGELGIGIPFEDLIKIDSKTLEESGWKGVSELVKAYNDETKKLKQESIDNFLDIIKNSKDFAQQIADIDRELQKDLEDLAKNYGGTDSEEYKRRSTELYKKAEEDKNSVRFNEFKESSEWIKVFDDLDRVSDATIDKMIEKIEEFARNVNLSVKDTKELVDALGKLRGESIERNPLQGFKDAINRKSYYKSLNSKVGEYNEDGKLITQQMVDDGIAQADKDMEDSALAIADKFQAVANAADLLGGLFENLGIDLGGLSDVLGGTASGAQAGAGIASALGIAGPWGAIAGAAVGMLSSVFAMHDKALQKEIEASEKREELLNTMSDNLESLLEKNLGGLYTMSLDEFNKDTLDDILNKYKTNKFGFYTGEKYYSEETRKKAQEAKNEDSYYKAQLASLMAQRDEVQEQMRLEKEKKGTDADKIKDYEQELYELENSIKDFARDLAETLYGIDFQDWAGQLSEALVDAWASGEDAAEAYRKTVTDILKDVGVSILQQKILEPILNKTMEAFLEQFEKDDGKLTDASMKILSGMYDSAEYAADATGAYLEGLKKLGIDVSATADDSSSGLSKEIEGVTEDTAKLLGSYLNAIRQNSEIKRALIEKLITDEIPEMNYIAQAQLRELSQIQANTAKNVALVGEIRDLVNRVVDKGTNKIKV